MPVELEFSTDAIRVSLVGALDFSTQDQLDAIIERVITDDSSREVRVDMARTSFIDSSALRALLRLRQGALADGKAMTIWNCNEKIREIFAVSGFDQVFVMR